MSTPQTRTDIIDLTDGHHLTSDEVEERRAEFQRIEVKIEALTLRRTALASELGLAKVSNLEKDSILFLDDSADVFDQSAPDTSKDAMASLEIDDLEFDERFAAFTSSDPEGDHRARRWFHTA